ncbi:MAG TPA: hypothetical protein VKU80_13305, partial [Planctomycetota bacterium]|nr:hypothetical protein [Planctomycetota bacterium]
ETARRGTEDNVIASWCVWCEFDFPGPGHKGKVCPPELVRKMLQEFPHQPSIVVRSGGGVQVYWLLREPATGEDLRRVKAVNKALVQHFTQGQYGADPQCVDLARIFRLPGTQNLKYKPNRMVDVSWWGPEKRYILDDFDFLPQEPQRALFGSPAAGAAPSESKPSVPAPGHSSRGVEASARPAPSTILDEQVIREIGKLLGGIWFEGHRHQMALTVAGMLAWNGIKYECAVSIIQVASTNAGGDTVKRLKDVQDTYNNFALGKEVSGKPKLLEMVKTEFPDSFRKKALQTMNAIFELLPKPPGRESDGTDDGQASAEPDFDIIQVTKFDSRPARFKVKIQKHGEDTDVEVGPIETEVMTTVRLFRRAFFEASPTNAFIANISQARWEGLISAAPRMLRKAPEVARLEGAVLQVLEEFLEQKKEDPEVGILKVFPGYDEEKVYFAWRAFKMRLKDCGLKATDQAISDILETAGWESDRIWIRDSKRRLWVKYLWEKGGDADTADSGKSP